MSDLINKNKQEALDEMAAENQKMGLYGLPKREWVGLTDDEGAQIWGDAHDIEWRRLVTPKEIVQRIEAKLREKNT